ncbi:putative Splicing factor 3B subunit 2 [Blattamonas nauphoetae]|uniref:Splicing factor 3B subunit 2 n=1 Tax=Blattamonas nauphoetae TaxID=2049346 RepID=A0ABQ9XRX9_9EUKA|nr:putative Splicing factor 3B subunit 2 [Blattamonas nauphoetae]
MEDLYVDPEFLEDEHFKKVIEKYVIAPSQAALEAEEKDKYDDKDGMLIEDEEPNKFDFKQPTQTLSKKKQKLMNRLSIAELKQTVRRPEVVEMHDANSREPRLLVHLKSARNTVPVPRHWIQKRKYLSAKMGIEKSLYRLPDYIERTEIGQMREAQEELESSKSRKQKQREKRRPKLGRVSVDYEQMHDAFFRYQTKPPLSIHGDIYYEGKEYEINAKKFKPGRMSDELKEALGMLGARGIPPPWLLSMQRYGPPPSYPNLKIPGLNAPIPVREGAQFGFGAGQWGKAPTDEQGIPLYGDVFAKDEEDEERREETAHWGQMEDEEEDSDESEEEEESEGMDVDEELADPTNIHSSGIQTVSAGFQSSAPQFELRKRTGEAVKPLSADKPYVDVPMEDAVFDNRAQFPSTMRYDLGAVFSRTAVPTTATSSVTTTSTNKNESEAERKGRQLAAELEKQTQQFKF